MTPEAGGRGRRVVTDVARLGRPALAIHGGAGSFADLAPDDLPTVTDALTDALEAGWRVLGSGAPALDAVVEAVAVMESSGRFNAGLGATATSDGLVELDAAVMDGASGAVGAVCAARRPVHPVRAARTVAAMGGPRSGPVLVAGEGADRLAAAAGLALREPGASGVAAPLAGSGTVGAVALDAAGHLAAATSTGGVPGQITGRVGDSPVPGAGTWADDATLAVSATGRGEAFIVAGFAHLAAWHLTSAGAGSALDAALGRALDAVARLDGLGGAVALGPDGQMVALYDTPAMARGWRDAEGAVVGVFDDLVEAPAGA